jgi:dolichyl-phosphate beta-glucosyltransferase
VIIPAFNEAHRLPRYLAEVVTYFDGRNEPYEVLIADDGSTDGTADAVATIVRTHPSVSVLRQDQNAGKGAAVRRGMLAAHGDHRLFADADGATPIGELKRLEVALAAGAQVAIGSRAWRDPSVSVVARRHRVLAGRVFNWIVRDLGVKDSQCGFKAFTGRAAVDLFGKVRTAGYGFDVELLLLARARGYRVTEVPVNWTEQPGSKVGVLANGPGMLWEIARARRRIRGR